MRNKEFLEYYYRELNFLRGAGAIFAKEYPSIASRLKMDGSATADPHVERLLESFAYLTARVQLNVDNVAKDVTDALLDVIAPHINRPIPSVSVAQFQVSSGGSAPPPAGFSVPRHTELFTYSSDDNICKFRTVYQLSLFPLILENVAIVSHGAYKFVPVPNTIQFEYKSHDTPTTYFLELTFRSKGGPLANFSLDELCFYINIADNLFKKQLYQAIFSTSSLLYCSKYDESVAMPMLPGSIVPLGLEREDMAVPPMPHEPHSYQLLQEFFHFFDKFMFFKVKNLAFLKYLRGGNFLQSEGVKILIPLANATSDWARKISSSDILLNCTPIVNLFNVTTDPISWDKKQTFYHLSPNAQKNRTMEIFQIDELFGVENGQETRLCPYFSLEKHSGNDVFWWSKLVPTKHKNLTGVDSLISFVDANSNVINPSKYVIYAKALCTNRFLSEDIQQNTRLQAKIAVPASRIICLQKPVFPQYALDKGLNNSKLIAQLSSNYLGFPYGNGKDVVDRLKCVLDMHIGDNNREYGQALLSQLNGASVTSVTKRIGNEAWRGFVDGESIELTLCDSANIGDWFLLAQILHKYFAINCQVNTFVDLVLKNGNELVSTFSNARGEQHSV
ncbi:MAG: type VI secretion system baseplate subunit TssF [Holosporales bacterium]|jgi:type VI secretion system protein ImpG|nr:type VI secretion system baseplate subunit TssF [Holosporales bacterium]